MQRIILFCLVFGLFLTNCKKEDSNNPITGDNKPDPISVPLGTAKVIGEVFDASGNPLSGVDVIAGSISATSDIEGKFELDGIGNSNLVPVTFSKNGYVSTQKIAQTQDDFTTSISAALTEVGNTTMIGINGGVADHGTMEVTFPKNAFVNENGAAFQGNAEVRATWFNPTSNQFLNLFPGYFEGEREDGTVTSIESFGFIDVEIWAGNQQLQLADGKMATIKVPVPDEIKGRAPQTIPLWHYDMNQAKWIEDGSAELVGDFYVGEVSHFTRWNCDVPQTVSFLEGYVVDENGTIYKHARVRAVGVDYTGFTDAYTDENGYFKIPVRESSEVEIFASHGGWFSKVRNETTTTTQNTKTINNIVIIKLEVEQAGWYQTADFNVNGDIVYLEFYDQNNGSMFLADPYKGWVTNMLTTDGGETWVEGTVLSGFYQRDTTAGVHRIEFHNQMVGIINANYSVFATTDGGVTWEAMNLSPNNQELGMTDVELASENIVYTLFLNFDQKENSYTLQRSNDLGQNWETVNENLEINFNGEIFWGFSFKLMEMLTEDMGFLWDGETIRKTTDGGSNFVQVGLIPEERTPKDMIFLSETEFILIYSDKIYKTSDAGMNWNEVATANFMTGNYEMRGDNIWVASKGSILYSTDKGNSWTSQEYTPNIGVNVVAFKNDLEGYAGGSAGFTIKTQTGGEK